jgi:type II secretory pathway pseudopilin PulG
VSRRRAPLRLASQGGYTAVEMIITMALTAIVSGAIFSSFLVLERIQAAWEQRDQARAVGVLAEQPLLRDVQAYKVLTTGSTLVLQSIPSTQPRPFKVTYSVQTSAGGRMVLNRSVTQGSPPTFFSNGTVAHGVQSLNTSCSGNKLTVQLQLDAISIRGKPQPVQVSPVLTLTPRNGC